MSPSTLFSTLTFPACALAAGLLLGGCDPASSSGGGPRSGSNSDDGSAQVGGGFAPSPECSYDCLETAEHETVCVQHCPDDCTTMVLRREKADNGSVDVTESISEQCPDDFPEPGLWAVTCEIFFSPSSSDCEDFYAAQTCQAAFDLCLPAD